MAAFVWYNSEKFKTAATEKTAADERKSIKMKEFFGLTPDGAQAFLYTITNGALTAVISDFGATLVRLFVPDRDGKLDDIVLGYDSAAQYAASDACFGATIGRNANRLAGASFVLGEKTYTLDANDGPNDLHGGFSGYHLRMWAVRQHTHDSLCLTLHSPHLDQGFPGNADISVTYTLHADRLVIRYEAVCDRDTVFNMTNHSYFNLAGHTHPERAMQQLLSMPARFFTPADAQSIPTGELRPVDATPMDFREPKPLGRDIAADYEPLHLQHGYDHNFEVFCNPCATLSDPVSGRTLSVCTDCPGLQLYTANYTDTCGKGGQPYPRRSGVCLETQFYPDAIHHAAWKQPITRAGHTYCSETTYRFSL